MRFHLLFISVSTAASLSAQTAISPSTPALTTPRPSFVPGGPALFPITTTPSNVLVNSTNSAVAVLSSLLTNLQAAITATLPALASFNNSFDFVGIDSNGVPTATPAPTGTPQGSGLTNALQNTNVLSATNDFGLAQFAANSPNARDTLRALLVLQSDLERLLPALNAVNGAGNSPIFQNIPGTAGGLSILVPESLTNIFETAPR
jgi:hypothetical protein